MASNSLGDDAHDVVFAHDQILGAFDLHGLARVLSEQDAVPDLDVQGPDLAVLEDLALADGHHLALIGLLPGGVGNHDPAGGLVLRVEALHYYAVVQGSNLVHHLDASISDKLAATYGEWPRPGLGICG